MPLRVLIATRFTRFFAGGNERARHAVLTQSTAVNQQS
jgi:hypothetical protein